MEPWVEEKLKRELGSHALRTDVECNKATLGTEDRLILIVGKYQAVATSWFLAQKLTPYSEPFCYGPCILPPHAMQLPCGAESGKPTSTKAHRQKRS
eukprot:1097702-Pleurochrysis_carterae.AAC.5